MKGEQNAEQNSRFCLIWTEKHGSEWVNIGLDSQEAVKVLPFQETGTLLCVAHCWWQKK